MAFSLQGELERILADVPREVLRGLIHEKTKSQGFKLSKREVKKIEEFVLNGKTGPFKLRRWQIWDRRMITLEFSSDEVDELERAHSRVLEKLPQVIDDASSRVVPPLLSALERRWPRERRAQQRIRHHFQKRLMGRWGKPLGLLRMLLVIALEFGRVINEEARKKGIEPQTVNVLTRLHARACQVTEEIICLLSSGLADGAMARWRTLFEIATVTFLVSQFREELAERYLAHDAIESYRAATQFQKYAVQLGYERYQENEFDAFRVAYDATIAKYGKSFAGSYGWAAKHLNNNDPKLSDLIDASGISHLQPYYKMASHNVHSNPKGALEKLGLHGKSSGPLLAGPSNFGLADPGNCAALSLTQISTALLNLNPTFDNVICVQVMHSLLGKIADTFSKAHTSLVEVIRTDRAARK